MHDLDRNDLVFESDSDDAGFDHDDYEVSNDDEDSDGEADGVFDDAQQSELAAELLAVTDDQELDQFLGNLIQKARRKLGPIARSVAGNVGSLLKGAIKTALPTVANLAGNAIGGPAGGWVADNGLDLFGLELEGLSHEDQEFEAAKQLVRMAGSAISGAADRSSTAPAESAARQAMIDAARRYVPGLVRPTATEESSSGQQQGTWYRRGNKIVIVGV